MIYGQSGSHDKYNLLISVKLQEVMQSHNQIDHLGWKFCSEPDWSSW